LIDIVVVVVCVGRRRVLGINVSQCIRLGVIKSRVDFVEELLIGVVVVRVIKGIVMSWGILIRVPWLLIRSNSVVVVVQRGV